MHVHLFVVHSLSYCVILHLHLCILTEKHAYVNVRLVCVCASNCIHVCVWITNDINYDTLSTNVYLLHMQKS